MTATVTEMSDFARTIVSNKYFHPGETDWRDVAYRVSNIVVGDLFPDLVDKVAEAIANFEFIPGGRQLANAGTTNMLNNCFLYRVADSKEDIGDFFRKGIITGMTGGGVGVVWSDLRPRGYDVKTNGGTSTGPCSFMLAFNEAGRSVVNGGSRRMAIWAGLHWWHPDVYEFMALKDWPEYIVKAKSEDYSAYAPMDMTNISIILDDEFFALVKGEVSEVTIDAGWGTVTRTTEDAKALYLLAVEKMLTTGEPGFSVDTGDNKFENLRNPCCEITSEDSDDVCCLGSVNIAAIDDIDRLAEVVALGETFLVCSTIVSEVPHEEVLETREKNRRTGLGLMGIHEWLLVRGYRYEPTQELADWLQVYMDVSDRVGDEVADALGVSRPVKKRAIAPAGTIGIAAQTTTGVEPLFAIALKRMYLDKGIWKYQYVIDATAQRLLDKGVLPKDIETAYDLAFDPARRLAMQAFIQGYVDHAISSTLNLPRVEWQSFSTEEFADMLMVHLPNLRGITAYPDGARGGQPLNVVDYAEAVAHGIGVEFEEFGLDQACVSGACGV